MNTQTTDNQMPPSVTPPTPQPQKFVATTIVLLALFLAIAIYLILAILFNFWPFERTANAPTTSETPAATSTAGWQTYHNNQYGFGLQYPPSFAQSQALNFYLTTPVIRFVTQTDDYPGTNYVDSSVNISTQKTNDCFVGPDGKLFPQTTIIDGITYHIGQANDAAAGNFYTSTLYRTLQGQQCFEIALTVHTGNIANYTPGTVTELNQSKPMATLRSILSTLTFTSLSTLDTSTWQIYRNDQYGFEFKYPQNLDLKEITNNTTTLYSLYVTLTPQNSNDYAYTLGVTNKSPDLLIQNLIKQGFTGVRSPTQIDNLSATKFQVPPGQYGGGFSNIFVVKNHWTFYAFGDDTYMNSNFNQILSTFKFTK